MAALVEARPRIIPKDKLNIEEKTTSRSPGREGKNTVLRPAYPTRAKIHGAPAANSIAHFKFFLVLIRHHIPPRDSPSCSQLVRRFVSGFYFDNGFSPSRTFRLLRNVGGPNIQSGTTPNQSELSAKGNEPGRRGRGSKPLRRKPPLRSSITSRHSSSCLISPGCEMRSNLCGCASQMPHHEVARPLTSLYRLSLASLTVHSPFS